MVDGAEAGAGAVDGDIRDMGLAGDAGDADGDLDTAGGSDGTLTGRFIRIHTGVICGGAIRTDTLARRMFTRTSTRDSR